MLLDHLNKWFQETGMIFFIAGVILSLSPNFANASEEIIFKYGGATQSVTLQELQTFVSIGETSASLETLFKSSKQNPNLIRWIIRQNFPADTKVVFDLLNTAPGEYVLSQTGNVIGSKSERANVKALRGALVRSASDDNTISLIELLENYPTKKVYVDGKILAKARDNLADFINKTNKYIKIPLDILAN